MLIVKLCTLNFHFVKRKFLLSFQNCCVFKDFDNPVRFDESLHRLVEMTDEEVEEAKKYVPADLEDADEIDWSFDEAFERSR